MSIISFYFTLQSRKYRQNEKDEVALAMVAPLTLRQRGKPVTHTRPLGSARIINPPWWLAGVYSLKNALSFIIHIAYMCERAATLLSRRRRSTIAANRRRNFGSALGNARRNHRHRVHVFSCKFVPSQPDGLSSLLFLRRSFAFAFLTRVASVSLPSSSRLLSLCWSAQNGP